MGNSVSHGFRAESISCINGEQPIEDLLGNPEYVRECRTFFNALDDETQDNVQSIVGIPIQRLAHISSPLRRILMVKSVHVGISNAFEPYYASWRSPKAFLTSTQTGLDGPWSVSRVYLELRNVRRCKTYDPIRERIFAVALYNLREMLKEYYRMSTDQKRWKKRMVELILESPNIQETKEQVLEQVRVLLRFGNQMKEIADYNGGLGSLMVMPSHLLTLSSWARLNGAEFRRGLEHLNQVGLSGAADKVDAHSTAQRIVDAVVKSMMSELGVHVAPRQLLSPVEPINEASSFSTIKNRGQPTLSCSNIGTSGQSSHVPQQRQTNFEALQQISTYEVEELHYTTSTSTPIPLNRDDLHSGMQALYHAASLNHLSQLNMQSTGQYDVNSVPGGPAARYHTTLLNNPTANLPPISHSVPPASDPIREGHSQRNDQNEGYGNTLLPSHAF